MITIGHKPTLHCALGDNMENQLTTPKFPFIHSYKQRAKELLTQGKNWDSIKSVSVLIENDDEYVCDAHPSFNIKKGNPFTELFLAVYDWVILNYTQQDILIDDLTEAFSYILLDPTNYNFETEDDTYETTITFIYENITYNYNFRKILNYESGKYISKLPTNLETFKPYFPMVVNKRKLTGFKKPYHYIFQNTDNTEIKSFKLDYNRENSIKPEFSNKGGIITRKSLLENDFKLFKTFTINKKENREISTTNTYARIALKTEDYKEPTFIIYILPKTNFNHIQTHIVPFQEGIRIIKKYNLTVIT